MAAGINLTRAPEFNVVAYSFSPPAESSTILDTEFTGYFNACVDGGRFRVNANANASLLLYGQGIYAYTKSEDVTAAATRRATRSPRGRRRTRKTAYGTASAASSGFRRQPVTRVRLGGCARRHESQRRWFYREQHLEYSIVKYLGGAWSIEIQGRHRLREEASQNLQP